MTIRSHFSPDSTTMSTASTEKSAKKKNYRKFWKLGLRDFNTEFFTVSKDGQLIVHEGNNQYNIGELAAQYGTPLRILFPFIIEQRVEQLIELFNHYIKTYKYRGRFYYHYPMKVNQNREFVMPIVSEGANLETTSANELWIVKRLWEQRKFNSRIKVICNGPKTTQYLELIEELKGNGLDIIPIIEDLQEKELLRNYRGQVGVRVDIDVKVNSHWDKRVNRFGLSEQEVYELGKVRNLTVLHYHMASELGRESDIINPLKKAAEIYVELNKMNPSLDTIDIGGGFPVNYTGKPLFNVQSVVHRIIEFLSSYFDGKNGVQPPNIICEWGAYMVGAAQMTVFSVIAEKDIPKATAKKWYVIDGSFQTHLLDTWAIHKLWHTVPVNHLHAKKLLPVWLAGMSCDSDDKYTAGSSLSLPKLEDLEPGERLQLAVLATGSYQDVFTNHHCLNAIPTRIVCQDGEVKVVRKRETPEEIGKQFGW